MWFVGDVQYVKIRLGFRFYEVFFCKDLSHSCKKLSFLNIKLPVTKPPSDKLLCSQSKLCIKPKTFNIDSYCSFTKHTAVEVRVTGLCDETLKT